MCPEDLAGEEHSGADNSPLAGTGLVFSSSGAGSGEASVTTNEAGHPSRSTQSATSTGEPRQTPVSRLESIRGKYSSAGISRQITDLLLAGWS